MSSAMRKTHSALQSLASGAGVTITSTLMKYIALEEICGSTFSLYLTLLSDFAVPGNGMLGRREQFMRQTTGMRRRNNGSYPPVTRALVIEQTSPKIRWFS